MRNRAKCKLCEDILESFHENDRVICKCGEISISGGSIRFECAAKNFNHFLRVDDLGNIIVPKIVPKDDVILHPNDNDVILPSNKISYTEKLDMLKSMVNHLDDLPKHVLDSPVNHYDLYSMVLVIISLLEQLSPPPSESPLSQDQ